MLLAVCIMMTALSYAHGLSTELFGTRYADALRNIESILGKPAKVEADKVIYNKVEYEGMTWDEAYFKFSDGQLVEARFYSRQAETVPDLAGQLVPLDVPGLPATVIAFEDVFAL